MNTRTCGNCACFAAMLADGTTLERNTDPEAPAQTVCQRTPPTGRWAAQDVPVFDQTTGAPVLARNGQQRSERRQVLHMGYPPAVATGVCYDGWRPVGTLPGGNYQLDAILPLINDMVAVVFPHGRPS